ncbi:CPBP family intramembrane glutamic endopeptidase [Vagococcus xieshaowenii]|uniref:CPBP family intramembrane metalloprotease n=1 Tax=Vagococcus xieshaowenii TaxID=2562451 RepID=A0AAJ5JKN7_9ENTE|nr:CPBP family intramembrane glutamic endopeptidase [Vagococcus xieshaowenii]QCA29383.1 CPBP family intramembrane metalloprotease [Vagococcus xieshaowenii]TFZ39326.1 CPBP family intramembrane metalloprotease [Vagococcus xieshaowenii]
MKKYISLLLQILLLVGLFIVYSLPSAFIMLGYEKIGVIAIFLVLIAFIGFYLSKTNTTTFPKLLQKKHLYYILGGYLAIYLSNIIISPFMKTDTTSNNEAIYDLATQINPVTLFFLLCVLAPIGEELLFRFGIIRLFGDITQPNDKIKVWIGLIISSIVFCIPHSPDSIPAFFAYTIMGFFLGLVYVKSKRIEVSMGLHFINNFLAYLVIVFASHLL